jgi:hypothetical protein
MNKHTLPLVLFALVGLSACSSFSDDPAILMSPAPMYERLVMRAPPPTIIEEPTAQANPRTEIWRPGFWDYSGSDYFWVPGTLMPRPSPTAVWSADRWVQHNYGWAFCAGHWN